MGTLATARQPSRYCSRCRFLDSCLLGCLDPEELSLWLDLQIARCYEKNDIVFWEEDEADGLYLVCSGVVKLIKSSMSGHQQILRLVGPGHFFGLPPLISQHTHFCTAQAIDRTQIFFIPRPVFLDFLERFPRFAFRIIDHLVSELRLARLRLRDFGCKTGRQRIADLLLWLGRKFGSRSARGIEIGVDLSRADLADMAGLTRETTIRLLSSFRREGMIEHHRSKRIVLLEPQRMQAISGADRPFDFGVLGPE